MKASLDSYLFRRRQKHLTGDFIQLLFEPDDAVDQRKLRFDPNFLGGGLPSYGLVATFCVIGGGHDRPLPFGGGSKIA